MLGLMPATLSPPAAELHERFLALSFQDKADLFNAIREELEAAEPPAWHMELLAEREKLIAAGGMKVSPLEEVKARLEQKWGRE